MCSRCRDVARAALLALALGALGCEREERRFQPEPRGAAEPVFARVSPLVPGPPEPAPAGPNPYGGNAWGIGEGQRLFTWFNCNGCHANGGGGMGPPLMDAGWIYGGRPEQIYASIAQGRPNGMPAFGTRVPAEQIWQLVAYVRSLSANVPKDARPGRPDAMQTDAPPTIRDPREPLRERGPTP
ncbi:MAG: cytochrome C [Proteobacteria bacterium]|nr:MAG: cytochrome C [Pseudomonadota bacterium]